MPVASFLLTLVLACAASTDAQRSARIDRLYHTLRHTYPEVPEISAAQLAALPEDSVVVVDVRPREEYAVSMLPGAITLEALRAAPERYQDASIVTYCTIGYRSGKIAAELQAEGLDATNLAGGVLAWSHAGLPLFADGLPTVQVHVYSKSWDLVADGYEAVW